MSIVVNKTLQCDIVEIHCIPNLNIKMSSSLKSLSQIWSKNTEAATEIVTSQSFNNAESESKPTSSSSSRRRLSKQFSSSSDSKHHPMLLRSRNVLTSLSNLNVGNVPKETKKLFQAGADKVTTTLNGVRSTIGNWSQVCNCRSNVCDLSYPTDYANDIFFIISTLYRS